MTRRRLVVLSSAFTLLGLGMIAGLAALGALKTQLGRTLARDYVEGLIAPRVKGKLYIGRISGLSIGGAEIFNRDPISLPAPRLIGVSRSEFSAALASTLPRFINLEIPRVAAVARGRASLSRRGRLPSGSEATRT